MNSPLCNMDLVFQVTDWTRF